MLPYLAGVSLVVAPQWKTIATASELLVVTEPSALSRVPTAISETSEVGSSAFGSSLFSWESDELSSDSPE